MTLLEANELKKISLITIDTWERDKCANNVAAFFSTLSMLLMLIVRPFYANPAFCDIRIAIAATGAVAALLRDKLNPIWRSLPIALFAGYSLMTCPQEIRELFNPASPLLGIALLLRFLLITYSGYSIIRICTPFTSRTKAAYRWNRLKAAVWLLCVIEAVLAFFFLHTGPGGIEPGFVPIFLDADAGIALFVGTLFLSTPFGIRFNPRVIHQGGFVLFGSTAGFALIVSKVLQNWGASPSFLRSVAFTSFLGMEITMIWLAIWKVRSDNALDPALDDANGLIGAGQDYAQLYLRRRWVYFAHELMYIERLQARLRKIDAMLSTLPDGADSKAALEDERYGLLLELCFRFRIDVGIRDNTKEDLL